MSKKTVNLTIDDLLKKVSVYNSDPDDLDLIRRAYDYAAKKHFGQKRITGEDYILHPLNVADILTEISADAECMAAALLHDTIEDSDATKEEIENLFGPEIALLVDGVTKINRINFSSDSEASAAYQRKILVGLSEDVRVIIIKLADRLHNMRTLHVLSEEKQKKKAKETLEILTPVAHRLGIYKIKSELEDLSFRYLKPDAYFDIVEKLNQKKAERDESVSNMLNEVSSLLNEHNIPHEIKGRSKSIYSIYTKMNKGKSFNDIYDILALRVFVDTEQECYLALGLIHSKYKPVPKRFKDYIAMPKPNLYQSLHTTVFGVDGNLFEIQIRTYDMDKIAEYGIASHWSYKSGASSPKKSNDLIEEKLQFFRSIIELNEDSSSPEEFVSSVKKDVLSEEVIYVYTPKGDVIELPSSSTPVDFAYKVHSEVGDHMVGAIVNDTIVSLDYKLNNGDIIKINTNKASRPSKDWLSFVVTSNARNKIKAYYNRLEKDTNIEKGMSMLEKELRKEDIPFNDFLSNRNIDLILKELKEKDLDSLYINISLGKFTPASIIKIVQKKEDSSKEVTNKIKEVSYPKEKNIKNDVLVEGMSEIKASISDCCKPVPGDSIIGYITRGYGITIHRTSCRNILDTDERLIGVKWNDNISKKYATDILVYTNSEGDILDIITKTSSNNIIIDSISTITKSSYKIFSMVILVENKEKLEKFMNDLKDLNFVDQVERRLN